MFLNLGGSNLSFAPDYEISELSDISVSKFSEDCYSLLGGVAVGERDGGVTSIF